MVPRCRKVVGGGDTSVVVELKHRCWVIAMWMMVEGWKNELEW